MRQDVVLRHLTGPTRSADTSYDVRIDDDRFYQGSRGVAWRGFHHVPMRHQGRPGLRQARGTAFEPPGNVDFG